jgi:hypothetical protein
MVDVVCWPMCESKRWCVHASVKFEFFGTFRRVGRVATSVCDVFVC